MEPTTLQDFCTETDWQGVRKTERIALVRAFLCYILHEQADLYTLVFFLDIQTFYQVVFAQIYSVRMTPIYLLFSHQDSFVNYDKDLCIKSAKHHNIAHQHIQACYEPRTHRCLVFALLIRLFTCSATTLVNTVFICRLTGKNKSLSLISWASWTFFL